MKLIIEQRVRRLKSRLTNDIIEETNMKNKPKRESKKLLCPKACVLNQLDDDRHSDTVVLETKKAIDSTLTIQTRKKGRVSVPAKKK